MTAKNSTWKMAAAALAAVACFGGCETISTWLPKHDKVTERENATLHDTTLSSNITPEQKLNVELAVAESLEEENQPDQAAKIYLNIIKKDGNCIVAYQRLGLLHAKKGEWEPSQKYFELAIKKAPKNVELQCDLGYTFYLQHRDREAEQTLRHAIGMESDCNRAHNDLGLLLARRGQENDALREFCAGGCNEAQAHANLAMAYATENRLPQAREQYRIALAADPNLAIAKTGLAALDSVDKNLSRGGKVEEAGLIVPGIPGAF